MIILPAIDIKDGNCVRLIKGDFDTVHKVAENPLQTARSFEQDGAEWLHMVRSGWSKRRCSEKPSGFSGNRRQNPFKS